MITLLARPAEISSTSAPSFWACLTEEFINTVQREPSSAGDFEKIAFLAKSCVLYPKDLANVSKKEPQPDEQASFKTIESIAPSLMWKHLISCPPMSIIKSTSGLKCLAAV